MVNPAIGVSSQGRALCAGRLREPLSLPQVALRISGPPLNDGLHETCDTRPSRVLPARDSESGRKNLPPRGRAEGVAKRHDDKFDATLLGPSVKHSQTHCSPPLPGPECLTV